MPITSAPVENVPIDDHSVSPVNRRSSRVRVLAPLLSLCLQTSLGAACIAWCAAVAQAQTAQTAMSPADRSEFSRALADVDAGRSQAAEPILRRLAGQYPANDQVNEAMGLVYADLGDMTQALPWLQRACQDAPDSALDHANLGAAWLKLGKGREAAEQLRIAARLDPGTAETWSDLGQAYMSLQEATTAARAFSQASSLGMKDPGLLYNWALALSETGDNAKAEQVLSEIPRSQMSDQAESLAGEVEEKLGHFLPAVQHDQNAAEKNPSEANLYALCVEYLRHWAWDGAERTATYGAEKYPGSVPLKLALGVALYGDKKFPEAAHDFADLLHADPNDSMAADMLGRTCGEFAGGNPDCDALESFAQQHTENASAAVYAARQVLEGEHSAADVETAQKLLTRATDANPKLADAWYELGVADVERQQWEQSAQMLEKAIALRPAFAAAHYQLAHADEHLHRPEDRKRELALFQMYSQQEKDEVNARVREMTVFLTGSHP